MSKRFHDERPPQQSMSLEGAGNNITFQGVGNYDGFILNITITDWVSAGTYTIRQSPDGGVTWPAIGTHDISNSTGSAGQAIGTLGVVTITANGTVFYYFRLSHAQGGGEIDSMNNIRV